MMYLYMAHFNKTPITRCLCRKEGDCWNAIKELESYGLEREYKYTKRELKKDGWSVHKYKLSPTTQGEK